MRNRESLRKLEKPTKLLLFGIVLGIALLAIGFAASQYYSHLVNNFVTECRNENQTPKSAEAPYWAKSPLVCDLHELESTATRSNDGLVGVQAKIVESHRFADAWLSKAYMLGAVLVGLCAIPYGWYFLLRRIRELSNAILGK